MNENLETLSLDVQNDFKKILENEPEMAKAISLVVKHVAGTYTDKYAKGIDEIDTKKMLYGKDGKPINVYQVCRYLQSIPSGCKCSISALKTMQDSSSWLFVHVCGF